MQELYSPQLYARYTRDVRRGLDVPMKLFNHRPQNGLELLTVDIRRFLFTHSYVILVHGLRNENEAFCLKTFQPR